ncbi:MAG TPA: mitochondrial fission ELM1 family protein [Thermomonas sp.]|nr:mitochondrial fission ELM1 family protein [Thermomonas sp.]
MSRALALHDGRAGNARQALALADALAPGAVDERRLQPGPLARLLAPRAWPRADGAFGQDFRDDCERPPALVVGCGRQAALATRLLRRRGSRAVQVLDPRLDPRHWDVVVVPAHDALRGDNVVTLQGSLHPVDDLWLARARAAAPALAALPGPRTLLLAGGPTRHAALDDAGFDALLRQLAAHARAEGGSLCAVASRRTPARWREALAAVDAGLPGLRWRDGRDGPNPYAGLLAHADRIVCTPDSVNMLSEAAATLAPVFAWAPARLHGRPARFLEALLAGGRVRALDDALAAYPVEPLRETARVAAEVRRRLGSVAA